VPEGLPSRLCCGCASPPPELCAPPRPTPSAPPSLSACKPGEQEGRHTHLVPSASPAARPTPRHFACTPPPSLCASWGCKRDGAPTRSRPPAPVMRATLPQHAHAATTSTHLPPPPRRHAPLPRTPPQHPPRQHTHRRRNPHRVDTRAAATRAATIHAVSTRVANVGGHARGVRAERSGTWAEEPRTNRRDAKGGGGWQGVAEGAHARAEPGRGTARANGAVAVDRLSRSSCNS
jgi:hypothetical protein